MQQLGVRRPADDRRPEWRVADDLVRVEVSASAAATLWALHGRESNPGFRIEQRMALSMRDLMDPRAPQARDQNDLAAGFVADALKDLASRLAVKTWKSASERKSRSADGVGTGRPPRSGRSRKGTRASASRRTRQALA